MNFISPEHARHRVSMAHKILDLRFNEDLNDLDRKIHEASFFGKTSISVVPDSLDLKEPEVLHRKHVCDLLREIGYQVQYNEGDPEVVISWWSR